MLLFSIVPLFVHSSDPWIHSWYRLIIKNRNTNLIFIHDFMFGIIMVIGMGNSKAISTLKIVKIPAIRKNCDENGSRAEFFGSHSHSNGDIFLGLPYFLKL